MQFSRENLQQMTKSTLRWLAVIPINLSIMYAFINLTRLIAIFFMDEGTKKDFELYGYYESTVIVYHLPYFLASMLFSFIAMFFASKYIVPFYKKTLAALISVVFICDSFIHRQIILMAYLLIVIFALLIEKTLQKRNQ